ncbi:hypothetical protein B9J78_05260 [bacterium Unc6]|nr:hypothetical protein [bacterium Unc6]
MVNKTGKDISNVAELKNAINNNTIKQVKNFLKKMCSSFMQYNVYNNDWCEKTCKSKSSTCRR